MEDGREKREDGEPAAGLRSLSLLGLSFPIRLMDKAEASIFALRVPCRKKRSSSCSCSCAIADETILVSLFLFPCALQQHHQLRCMSNNSPASAGYGRP